MKKLVPIKMSLNTQETRHLPPKERIVCTVDSIVKVQSAFCFYGSVITIGFHDI